VAGFAPKAQLGATTRSIKQIEQMDLLNEKLPLDVLGHPAVSRIVKDQLSPILFCPLSLRLASTNWMVGSHGLAKLLERALQETKKTRQVWLSPAGSLSSQFGGCRSCDRLAFRAV
jgi:hypothetical protein